MPAGTTMRVWVGVILTAAGLWAGDPQRLALFQKAQAEFERVSQARAPLLTDTVLCVQSQAAFLPVALPEELPLVHYRKGWCGLAGATITHDNAAFSAAADEFDKAVESWPVRLGHSVAVPPVSSGLRVLAWVARLEAGDGAQARERIAAALENPACPEGMMPPEVCHPVLAAGREWLGWMALQRDDLAEATQDVADLEGEGWGAWVAGRRAFERRDYPGAVREYQRALAEWKRKREDPAPAVADRLGPAPDLGRVLLDLGGAQLLTGDSPAAIVTLNEAIKAAPSGSRGFYLRARARELAGQSELAMADYDMASRAAFASALDLASGEAHLYRGIALYRRKSYARAEAEFASALNFRIGESQRADAVAWRHLSAVAGGSCGVSRVYLERALGAVSPYFPRDEARAAMAVCPAAAAAGGL